VRPLPLLSEHPRSVQFVLAFAVPALYGAVTGYFLGVSEPTYLVLSLIGIVGAIGAGFDHLGARAGARRGVIAGSVFGAFILIAHEIHGADATAHLPEPAIVLVLITTVLAIAFAALGGWLRQRAHSNERAAAEAHAPVEPVAEPEPAAGEPAVPKEPLAAAPPPEPVAAGADGGVSLNSGSFDEYRALGMSVTQATRVIAYRGRLDGYSSLDELERVPGFSREFLAEMKQQLTL